MQSSALFVEGLYKTYKNGKKALVDFNLSVPEGSFFALLGPNGAGKTTMINILADVVRPTAGRAFLFGRDMFKERRWAKTRMGVVPQEVAFDPFFSAREVLEVTAGLYGCKPDPSWIAELLSQLGLYEHAEKNTRQLSGGMRRRLLVAQALVHRPPLVILDEPTAGVDVELRRRIWDFMRTLNRNGTTILLTTHYLEEAEMLCDRVAILNHGRVLWASPMQELLSKVASSHLMLQYERNVALDETTRQALEGFDPWLEQEGKALCLRIRKDDAQGFGFHAAYTKALSLFGPPLHVEICKEDLEDVFLRLIRDGVAHGA